MTRQEVSGVLKEILLSLGADACGVGTIDRFAGAPEGFSPLDLYAECKSVIVFGRALPKGLTQVAPRIIYGHFNYFTCPQVDGIALDAAREIEKRLGAVAVPLPCDVPYEAWDAATQTGHGLLSFKHAAALCGLGEIGKNTLLIHPQYGNLLTLGAILTNLEAESDPLCEGLCIPGCRKCLDACPAHAIGEGRVRQDKCRPNTYGKTARGFDTVDCNRCRVVCPRRFGVRP